MPCGPLTESRQRVVRVVGCTRVLLFYDGVMANAYESV